MAENQNEQNEEYDCFLEEIAMHYLKKITGGKSIHAGNTRQTCTQQKIPPGCGTTKQQ